MSRTEWIEQAIALWIEQGFRWVLGRDSLTLHWYMRIDDNRLRDYMRDCIECSPFNMD